MLIATKYLYQRTARSRWHRKKLQERFHVNRRKHETYFHTNSGLKASGFDLPAVSKQILSRSKRSGSNASAASQWSQTPMRTVTQPGSRSNMGAIPFHAIQGRGDDESLSSSMDTPENQKNLQLYGKDAWKYAEEPLPYTPLMARKLQSGNLWPKAPEEKTQVRTLLKLRNDDDMTYRAKHYAFQVEYWIRRDLKALPGVLGDMFNFQQFILVRVICSDKRRHMYIVWSTVHPGARYELEPVLTRLKPWVYRKIKQRIKKHTPAFFPEITWVYEQQEATRIDIPQKLKNEVKEAVSDLFNVNLQQKVEQIQKMGTIEMRLSKTPWYMPYLWAKEERIERRKKRADFLANADSSNKFQGGGKDQDDAIMAEMTTPVKQII